jgi:hypothetical protein
VKVETVNHTCNPHVCQRGQCPVVHAALLWKGLRIQLLASNYTPNSWEAAASPHMLYRQKHTRDTIKSCCIVLTKGGNHHDLRA